MDGTWWVWQRLDSPEPWEGDPPADALVGDAHQLVRGDAHRVVPTPDGGIVMPTVAGRCALVVGLGLRGEFALLDVVTGEHVELEGWHLLSAGVR